MLCPRINTLISARRPASGLAAKFSILPVFSQAAGIFILLLAGIQKSTWQTKIVIGICCVILILMLKPYFEVNSKMLVGSYVYNQDYLSTGFPMYDSIYIYANNTYKHIYVTSTGEIVEKKDRWEYIAWFREIRMEHFMGSGSWFAKVEKAENDQIRIYYAREERIFYYKTNK